MFPREKKQQFFSLSSHPTPSSQSKYIENEQDSSPSLEDLQRSEQKIQNSILFSPKFFQLSSKIYKDQKIPIISSTFLPKMSLTLKLLKKIQSNLSQNKTKTAYLYGNQFKFVKNSSNRLEPVYILKEISYATDESFEEKFQQMQSFPITLFCQNSQEQSPIASSKSILLEQMEHFKKGLSSFQNLDCSQTIKKLSDVSLSEAHPIYDCEVILDQNPLDLIFLNNFRLFLYSKSSKTPDTFSLMRLLAFPSLDFSIQMISQPFKLVSTPLTHILTKKSNRTTSTANSFITASNSSGRNKKSSIKFGFLTLDQNHRICPLMASDPISLQVPLIGVWIFGVSFPKPASEFECKIDENYLIWSVLAEYVKNQHFFQKYSFDERKKSFFLACFSSEENPKFYEVELQKNKGFGILQAKGEIESDNDYEDLGFEKEGIVYYGLEELLNLERENSEFLKKKSKNKETEKVHTTHDFKKEGKKLTVEDLSEMPREKPKMEEFNNYLSPRTASNNTFGVTESMQMNSMTEKLFQEQAKQLKFLQEQVFSLTEALKQQQTAKISQENNNKTENMMNINNNKEILNFYKNNNNNKNLVNQSTNTTFLVDKETNLCVLGKFPKNEKIIESKTDHQRNQNEKIQSDFFKEIKPKDNCKNMKTTGTDPEMDFQEIDRNFDNLRSFKEQEDENLLRNNNLQSNENNNNNNITNNFFEDSLGNSDFLSKNGQMIFATQRTKQDLSVKNPDSELSHFEIKGLSRQTSYQENSFQKSQPNSFIVFNNNENPNESIISSMKGSLNQEDNMNYSQNFNKKEKFSIKNYNIPQANEKFNQKQHNQNENVVIPPNLIQNSQSVHNLQNVSYCNDYNKSLRNPPKTENYSNLDKENYSFHSNFVKPSKNPSPKIKKDRKTQNQSTYFMRNDFLNSVKKRPSSQNVEIEVMEPETREGGKECLAIPMIKFEKEKYKGDSDSSEDEEIKKIQKKYLNKLKY